MMRKCKSEGQGWDSDCEDRLVPGVWEPPWDTYHCIGVAGSVSGPQCIYTVHSWQTCSGENRQFYDINHQGAKKSVCVAAVLNHEAGFPFGTQLTTAFQTKQRRFLLLHSGRSAPIQLYILHPLLFFSRLFSLLLHPAKEEN